MSDPTWQNSIDSLRGRIAAATAQASAGLLIGARQRWQHTLVARTAGNDLLFTRPGDAFPFDQSVQVSWREGTCHITLHDHDSVIADEHRDHSRVDRALDTFLSRLAGESRVCRRCGRPVEASRDQFEVFEQMHYVCFHYEFEHDPRDPDEECSAGGCPSAAVTPAQRPEQPRDSLVEEIVDALANSELGQHSPAFHLDRIGPGIVLADFGASSYLVTVRTNPRT
jgi:hypothetical protein